MNKLSIVAAWSLLVIATGVILSVQPSRAEIVMTPELTERVKTHCVENQATLNRLHQADAFLRNERGDLYRTISDKLMVPLNRRIADNQLDGSDMIATTAQYNQTYTKFYNSYIAYDNALAKLLKIDCKKEPVTFYTTLIDAREKRSKLSDDNQDLIQLVDKYGTQFKTFQKEFNGDEA